MTNVERHLSGAGIIAGVGRRRIAVLVAIALVVLVVPLIAVGATQGWWFSHVPGAPKPVGGIVVVKAGHWNGVPWALTAYRTADANLCFGLTATPSQNPSGVGGGMACGTPTRGLARQSATYPTLHWVGFLESGADLKLPDSIVGPAAPQVATVDIVLTSGQVVNAPTFDAPKSLGVNIRFYAAQLPCHIAARVLIPRDTNGQPLEQWTLHTFKLPGRAGPCG